MPEQAKRMQGFPDNFEFPVPKSQAMKQLGNSVAVDAVKACAENLIDYMNLLEKQAERNEMGKSTKNKGEWTELYSFLKLLNDRHLVLADKDLNPTSVQFNVNRVTTLNMQKSYYLTDKDLVCIENKDTSEKQIVETKSFLNNEILDDLSQLIKNSSGSSFEIAEFNLISDKLGIHLVKGGNSNQKSDIVLDITNQSEQYLNQGFGIKSYLGNKPTLLNASGNTNFIYKVVGLPLNVLDEINAIDTKTKLKDCIAAIYEKGGKLIFEKVEQTTMGYNLDLVDSIMPNLIALMLIEFHKNRINTINENLTNIYIQNQNLFSTNLDGLKIKVKKLLVSILLGFFAGSKWNGQYLAKGTIVVKSDGSQVGYHITDLDSLENYLYDHIRFDTPSTTRHRYGSLIAENGELFFKLNLQLRF